MILAFRLDSLPEPQSREPPQAEHKTLTELGTRLEFGKTNTSGIGRQIRELDRVKAPEINMGV